MDKIHGYTHAAFDNELSTVIGVTVQNIVAPVTTTTTMTSTDTSTATGDSTAAVDSTTPPFTAAPAISKQNLIIIIGVSCGLVALTIIIVIIAVIVRHNKK